HRQGAPGGGGVGVDLALGPAGAGGLAPGGLVEQGAQGRPVVPPQVQEVAGHLAAAFSWAALQAPSSRSITSRASSTVMIRAGSNRTQFSPPPAISRRW